MPYIEMCGEGYTVVFGVRKLDAFEHRMGVCVADVVLADSEFLPSLVTHVAESYERTHGSRATHVQLPDRSIPLQYGSDGLLILDHGEG